MYDDVAGKICQALSHGFTPLMFAAREQHAGIVQLLLKRGADGAAKCTPTMINGDFIKVRVTALDLARCDVKNNKPNSVDTLAVMCRRCCSACGMTSPGLSATTAGGGAQHLKRCGNCPARGPRARYCSKQCQRADWVPRHRAECAEARRARQAAGTEV